MGTERVKRVVAMTVRLDVEVPAGVCEHGDHAAPAGRRFCSAACEECEQAECDHSLHGCADLCQKRGLGEG